MHEIQNFSLSSVHLTRSLTGNIVEGGCSCIIMLILGVLGIIVAVAFVTGIVEAMIE